MTERRSSWGSAQRWRVSRNGEVTFGIVRRFRRRWRRNGARDRIGERHHGRRRTLVAYGSRVAPPPISVFPSPRPAPFREILLAKFRGTSIMTHARKISRNPHHNPRSSAGGTSIMPQQINTSTNKQIKFFPPCAIYL